MNEIDKMKRYIDRTEIKFESGTPYQMRMGEPIELSNMATKDSIKAICLAFEYGRAKGCRAMKATARGTDQTRR